MKTLQKKYQIIFISTLLICIIACKKETDPRDKYIGDYYFTVNEKLYDYSTDTIITDTTYYYNGTITKSDGQDLIIIQYLPNTTIWAQLLGNGKLIKPPGALLGVGFSGNFENNEKVSFTYSQVHLIFNVTGTKY